MPTRSANHANGTCLWDFACQAVAEWQQLLGALERAAPQLDGLARWTADLILGGARLLVCGNGGSAA